MQDFNAEDSKTDVAYRLLRREILTAQLPPNMALRPTALNQAYGLSWTPVREALARLEAERLVVYQRNRGFSVAPVSSQELEDLRRARQAIELPLLKESIENGDAEWEAQLVAAHHRLLRCPLPVDDTSEANLAQWERLHSAFHRGLLQAAVSQWLLRFQAQISEQLQRHQRVLAIAPTLQGKAADRAQARLALRQAMGAEQHTQLLQAALDRDVERALTLMTEHSASTSDVFEHSPSAPEKKPRKKTTPATSSPEPNAQSHEPLP